MKNVVDFPAIAQKLGTSKAISMHLSQKYAVVCSL